MLKNQHPNPASRIPHPESCITYPESPNPQSQHNMGALKYRLISGFALAGALLAGLFFLPPLGVLVVLLIACTIAMVEFYALLDASKIPCYRGFGIACGLLLVGGTWYAMQQRDMPGRYDVETVLLYLVVAVIFVRQIVRKEIEKPWETISGTFLGILYVAFLFNFLTKILTVYGDLDGRLLLFYLVAVVKMTDIGAFFTGCSIGRHKLIPHVSPAKTWEGCAGGVLFAIGASVAFLYLVAPFFERLSFTLTDALILAPLLAVTGIIGDLAESLLKRSAGVKDSGTFIQGMGGILDVLDSLIFTAPLLYAYSRLFMDNLP